MVVVVVVVVVAAATAANLFPKWFMVINNTHSHIRVPSRSLCTLLEFAWEASLFGWRLETLNPIDWGLLNLYMVWWYINTKYYRHVHIQLQVISSACRLTKTRQSHHSQSVKLFSSLWDLDYVGGTSAMVKWIYKSVYVWTCGIGSTAFLLNKNRQ